MQTYPLIQHNEQSLYSVAGVIEFLESPYNLLTMFFHWRSPVADILLGQLASCSDTLLFRIELSTLALFLPKFQVPCTLLLDLSGEEGKIV